MHCPTCGSTMAEGEVSIHGTPLGFLFVGISYQKLWFLQRGFRKEALIPAWGKAGAFHCRDCGATFLPGKPSTPRNKSAHEAPNTSVLDELTKRQS